MKKLAKRVLLLFAATMILASATPLLQAVVPQVQNTAYAQADDTEDTEAANEEQMEACYDDYAHITGTDIDLPKNPLRWFTCAVGQTLIEVADGLNRLVMRLLFFDPTRNRQEAESFYGSSCEYTTGDANCASTAGIEEEGINQLRKTWGNILTLANIILVVAFLIMVISTALDLGVFSNYTIKKMLPRIIIAAIAANLSWGICSILVQTVNNIGIGVGDFMTAPFVGSLQETIGASGGSGSTTMGALLIAAIGAFMVAIYSSGGAILLVILATVALVIGVAFLVVIIRRILLTLLIVVAPFAFIAWAVPGGEGLFKKWWKLFSQMLLLFPVTMVLFAAGIIVAALAGSVGTGIGGGYIDDIATSVVALISIVAPYAMIPYAIKLSSGVLGNIANIANDKSKGMLDRSRNWGGYKNKKNIRAEGKEQRKGARADRARSDALQKQDKRLGRSGLRGRWAERQVGGEDAAQILQANAEKDRLRVEAAKLESKGARRQGHTVKLQEKNAKKEAELLGQGVAPKDVGSILKAEMEDRAVATTDQQEYFAIIQELARQKADDSIGRVQARLAQQGTEGAVKWNSGVNDNEVFGAMTGLNSGFGQSISPTDSAGKSLGEAHQNVSAGRTEKFVGKTPEKLAGSSEQAWKEAVHSAVSRGDQQQLNKIFAALQTIEANDNLNGQLTIDSSALSQFARDVQSGAPGSESKYKPN